MRRFQVALGLNVEIAVRRSDPITMPIRAVLGEWLRRPVRLKYQSFDKSCATAGSDTWRGRVVN